MSYAEYLKSPRWAELRQEALERDGGRCRVCNASMGLEVHHRCYDSLGTEDEIEDLTTLCASCHGLFSRAVGEARGLGFGRPVGHNGRPGEVGKRV